MSCEGVSKDAVSRVNLKVEEAATPTMKTT